MRKTFTKIISEKNDNYINMLSAVIYLVGRGGQFNPVRQHQLNQQQTSRFGFLAKGASIAFDTARNGKMKSIRGKSVEFVRVVFCANSDRWGNRQQKKRRDPNYADKRNFTKQRSGPRTVCGSNAWSTRGNSLDKAPEVYRAAIQHRPRGRLTIRQRNRVLELWPNEA